MSAWLEHPIDAFRGGDVDLTADPAGHGKCLGQDFKASNSVALPPQENDLAPIFPDWRTFFGDGPIYFQVMRRTGDFKFDADVDVPLRGESRRSEPKRPASRFSPAWARWRLWPLARPSRSRDPAKGRSRPIGSTPRLGPARHFCGAAAAIRRRSTR